MEADTCRLELQGVVASPEPPCEARGGQPLGELARSVLEAAAAPSDSVTVSAGAHGDAWAALVAVTDRVQSTLEQGHDLLGDQRNAALAPGDVLMLWHQNTGEEERYLDHVAILVDDDLYLEKAGSGAETPFRLIDWDGLVASWPPAVSPPLRSTTSMVHPSALPAAPPQFCK